MAEQRIVITIDENGKINASTEGIKVKSALMNCKNYLAIWKKFNP